MQGLWWAAVKCFLQALQSFLFKFSPSSNMENIFKRIYFLVNLFKVSHMTVIPSCTLALRLFHWVARPWRPGTLRVILGVYIQWNDFTGKVQLTFANRWVGAAFDGRHGSSIASPWDWELLKRIAARLCPAATSTNSRRPTSGGNQRRPRKQGRGKRHSTEWNISLQQF